MQYSIFAGNYFAASGSLKGGKIHGEYPDSLKSSGSRIVSDVGIVIPTTPWDALWNGVAEWFGVNRYVCFISAIMLTNFKIPFA